MRRSPKVAEVLPTVSAGAVDFRELLGEDAAGLSATIARLTRLYQAFRGRDLSACDYVSCGSTGHPAGRDRLARWC